MYVMVDIEADGPSPGDFSMICFGAVIVDESLNNTFYGELCPISGKYIPKALAPSGFTREQTLLFPEPISTMNLFRDWVKSIDRPMFISDNNGFDWMFINWYFHHFCEENPFGFSSTNLGSFYKGLVRNVYKNFKYLRQTKHTHNPVDDAKGNAEALITLAKRYNLKGII